MIRECNVSYHFFADDSQLHDAAEPLLVPSLVQETTLCIGKVSDWMKANKLKMNDEKTEIIPIGTNSRLKQVSVSSLVISSCEIPPPPPPESMKSGCVPRRNALHGLSYKSSLQDYVELLRIIKVRPFISVEAANKLIVPLCCRGWTIVILN